MLNEFIQLFIDNYIKCNYEEFESLFSEEICLEIPGPPEFPLYNQILKSKEQVLTFFKNYKELVLFEQFLIKKILFCEQPELVFEVNDKFIERTLITNENIVIIALNEKGKMFNTNRRFESITTIYLTIEKNKNFEQSQQLQQNHRFSINKIEILTNTHAFVRAYLK
eukprot:TRINITY_DN2105_c0_g1_i1.p1 TRINITY_DN2105_c0_g1~~TRINITY_DN2105_c0_g1_i1.p1  ORF type:complete len:167 (+),score=66.87 TRINITY_DN2105_c0_g1_i1:61-561(+)